MYFIYIFRWIRRCGLSDFIQGVILLGGALVIIILGVMNIKGGFGTVFVDAIEHKN